ncbi:Protein FAM91A1 [Aphelenchoides besseyi]|nr:Protein FAM91A1 [Aphelenchoides besseyi]
MSGEEIEQFIVDNVCWSDLPHHVQAILGNSAREYDKLVLEFSVKNQLRHKGNIVRNVKKNAEEYYELVLKYSINNLLLYPYHLADVFVCGLRITPFEFYHTMIQNIMKEEKSYDSLPNFTAADALRLLGIGRNQYIEMMNQSRSYRKLFRRKTLQELLPQQPVDIAIEPWWMLRHGCILETDVKSLALQEKEVLDRLLEGFPLLCGLLEKQSVCSLYNRGLVYLEVPVSDEDYVYVPTLENFVMNRVNSDYLENLLYKIFVTIDGQMSVKELSDVIGVSIELVKNAISVFCRLGFAKKRNTGLESVTLNPSWQNMSTSRSMGSSLLDESVFLSDSFAELSSSLTNTTMTEDDEFVSNDLSSSVMEESISGTITSPTSSLNTPLIDAAQKRIAFVLDSSLSAILMLGNLSPTLKRHAVTLFEVGKLSDEAVGNFIEELAKVNFFAEGEVQRYSEHAKTLLHTLKTIKTLGEIDLIRGESLLNLDERARQRMIQKSYRLLLSMTPISSEACAFSQVIIPHIGSPVVEMASPWFRLYLYNLIKNGPTSLFISLGTCLRTLPKQLKAKRLITTSGNHEPIILLADSSLVQLGENLLSSSIFVQEYSDIIDGSEMCNIPFPFQDTDDELKDERHLSNHPAIARLRSELNLDLLCGYVTLLKMRKSTTVNTTNETDKEVNLDSEQQETTNESDLNDNSTSGFPVNLLSTVSKDPRKVCSSKVRLEKNESFDDYVVFDCVFGVALFDEWLNQEICRRIVSNDLFSPTNLENNIFAMRNIVDSVKEFVGKNRDPNYTNPFGKMDANFVPLPTSTVLFDSSSGTGKWPSTMIEKRILGILLLLIVNIVWVASAEVSKYLFSDLHFQRPFFVTYVKSCLFSIFLLRYILCGPQAVELKDEDTKYDKLELNTQSDCESSYEDESLTTAEFEPVHFPSDIDSEIDSQLPNTNESKPKKRKIRFSLVREVRSFPAKIATEARAARLPYKPQTIECDFKMSPVIRYTLYFAPLWVLSSVTYQAALVYSSVSTVNLISASSSLFVLVFGALLSSHSADRFSWTKLLLVLINLSGVAIVSQFSTSIVGASLSFVSAMIYAIYLVVFSVMSRRTGSVDMNLMFGVIGLFSFVVCTPLLVIVHHTGLEPQLPFPTNQEIMLIILNSLIGSIFSDYLWLYATLLTNGLVASISLTLTIPLSMIADVVVNGQLPDLAEMLSAIPIMTSFVAATMISNSKKSASSDLAKIGFKLVSSKKRAHDVAFSNGSENTKLMTDQDDLEI